MMDELARYNMERWEALAQANVIFSRPMLDLDAEAARAEVDPHGLLGDVRSREVLCLAASGGQQSAAFGLLGARATVFDLSETQLARDRLAAEHYGFAVRTVQGDMRDLSAFPAAAFDVVWHAYSINFVPDVELVFDEVARVLRPGGIYRTQWANPFGQTIDERSWNGEGYLLKHPYREGLEITAVNPEWNTWDVEDLDGTTRKVAGPREFVHTLSAMINGLARRGFSIRRCDEYIPGTQESTPGTWQHLTLYSPAWFTFWTEYHPASG